MLENFSSENRAVYEIMWENVVQPDRTQYNTAHALCKSEK